MTVERKRKHGLPVMLAFTYAIPMVTSNHLMASLLTLSRMDACTGIATESCLSMPGLMDSW